MSVYFQVKQKMLVDLFPETWSHWIASSFERSKSCAFHYYWNQFMSGCQELWWFQNDFQNIVSTFIVRSPHLLRFPLETIYDNRMSYFKLFYDVVEWPREWRKTKMSFTLNDWTLPFKMIRAHEFECRRVKEKGYCFEDLRTVDRH